MTLGAIIVGIMGMAIYSYFYVMKKRQLPNLGALIILFLAGIAIDEIYKIFLIFKHLLVDEIVVNFGIIQNHQEVVVLGAVALSWATIKTYIELLSSVSNETEK